MLIADLINKLFKSHKYLRPLFLILIVLGLALLIQSLNLSNQADQKIKDGQADEAITLYNKAYFLFPLRWDLSDKLKGAKLIQQSNLEYKKISEVGAELENAEIQSVPSLSNLPSSRILKATEVLVPVLMYHHIRINPRPYNPLWESLTVSPGQLDAQFQYLASHNFHTISLEQLYQALQKEYILPPNPIVLTFDDGYKNFYENAYPLLKKYQFKATQFIISGVTKYPAYLSWDQVVELDKSGLVEIEAHTRTHPNLSSLSQAAILGEIKGSKDDIETHIKKPVHFFAYPYGNYNDFIIKTVKETGYLGATSVIYGSTQSLDSFYLIPRIMVDGRFSLDEFAKRLYK